MEKTPLEQFKQDITDRVSQYPQNQPLQSASQEFFNQIGIGKADYVYNFTWLGVPIIQIPQDLYALQEMIWKAKPDLIIEAGIAWGGTLIHSASMLAILEACDEIDKGHVLGIDVEIRPHNKAALANHPLSKKITMLEGSSIDDSIISQVKEFAKGYKRIMVCLDSNHTHEHVLAELEAYAPLVSQGSYCMVGDTVIEDAPDDMTSKRPWGKGNNPKTAVWAYLAKLENESVNAADGSRLLFEMDKELENKLVLTGSPDGYLLRK
ncbi:cephalosporin hydroxylase family protein [Methylophaga muralis]|uniref:Rhamnosyl O-methyltransferase n=1 Tax=Methylophaga muralis TaxID=291169 RepID=A0A1E3GR34_9GAMM|nr:cephalosporin hydroxylase family protein [Methylophaga muralis]ODN66036.1 Rhamnosyl O-methyltransferase precursor [Methylophaga muralis]